MPPAQIQLEVVTPSRRVLSAKVDSIEIPGKDGYLGVLPGHAPLITELGIGALSYIQSGQTHYLTIIEGFAEVLGERVIVLAEVSERAEEIDATRAQSAAQRAQERLAKSAAADVDYRRASVALQRALIRQEVAAKSTSAIAH
jgi:F-type H+-transporting ATPase subunit epsilon